MSGLMEHSRILLYGRAVTDITLSAADSNQDSSSGSAAVPKGASGSFVSVYGFEFEGHYYDLPKPAILMVNGTAQTPTDAGAVVQPHPILADNIQVWSVNKGDMSVRLDVDAGPLEDILLEQAIDAAGLAAQTSAKRVSGKRVSGKRMTGD